QVAAEVAVADGQARPLALEGATVGSAVGSRATAGGALDGLVAGEGTVRDGHGGEGGGGGQTSWLGLDSAAEAPAGEAGGTRDSPSRWCNSTATRWSSDSASSASANRATCSLWTAPWLGVDSSRASMASSRAEEASRACSNDCSTTRSWPLEPSLRISSVRLFASARR